MLTNCMIITLTIFLTSANYASTGNGMHPLSDEFIQYINSKQNLWRAGRNFAKDVPMSYLRGLTGSLRDIYVNYLPRKTYDTDFERVPKDFDARLHWPDCPTLYDIRDQGSCSSCWAVSAVSAMTDRVCIQSKGKKHFYFSAEDVISCCRGCGPGCRGGVLTKAWLFSTRKGIVSGGGYGSKQGCVPYEFQPCEHDVSGPRQQCGPPENTPKCKKTCEPNYIVPYKKDKTRFKRIHMFNTTRDIKKEIYRNGPVTTSFRVYSDFLNYKNGIYYHVEGEYIGGHSVKLLGWGVDNGVKYWLAANSWNTDWGDNGFFKILRGKNTCGIENFSVAGV